MTPPSPDTRAILLLTAPLLAGRGTPAADLLGPTEYRRLARRLHALRHRPGDLLDPGATGLIRELAPAVDGERVHRLLDRGFLLAQAVERWRARAIWVTSRAEDDYPTRWRVRLKGEAPPLLYGCGARALLEQGGLAVVGSRNADEGSLGEAAAVGALAAAAGRAIVSGGARGVDRVAMAGSLDAGGRATGVLADGLERAALNRANRAALLDGRLVLVSPSDPAAGFNVGRAMARNRLIYALADAALVVSVDAGRGGTWAGATEQLDRLRLVAVHVLTPGTPAADALLERGALAWPGPRDPAALAALLDAPPPPAEAPALEQTDGDGILALLSAPKTEAEIAAALGLGRGPVRTRLKRLVADKLVERSGRPAVYALAQPSLDLG